MGQRLQVTQLCINTAIVYMHRFYMFQSFTKFHRNNIAAACLFLAAKVEEQPRKLEHVIKVAHMCTARDALPLDVKSEAYLEQAQELVVNENILLQTLGFEITVDHPHTQVVKTCQLVHASKDLAQTSYFLATNSLHLTMMSLQYKPTVVACVCIHLACKWANLEWPQFLHTLKQKIPSSSEGKEWFWYADKSVTPELLEELTQDFLNILDKCPSKLKKKILTWKTNQANQAATSASTSEVDGGPLAKKVKVEPSPSPSASSLHKSATAPALHDPSKALTAGMHGTTMREPILSQLKQENKASHTSGQPGSSGHQGTPESSKRPRPEAAITPQEYLQRKERERLEREKAERERAAQGSSTSTKHPSSTNSKPDVKHRTETYHDFSPKKSKSPLMHHSSEHALVKGGIDPARHKASLDVKPPVPPEAVLRDTLDSTQIHHRSEERSKHRHHHHHHQRTAAPRPSQVEPRRHGGGEVGTQNLDGEHMDASRQPRRESHRERHSKEQRPRHSSSQVPGKEHAHSRKRPHHSPRTPTSSQEGERERIPPLKLHRGEKGELTPSPNSTAPPPTKVPTLKIKIGNGNGSAGNASTFSPVAPSELHQVNRSLQQLIDLKKTKLSLEKRKPSSDMELPPLPPEDSHPPPPPLPPPE